MKKNKLQYLMMTLCLAITAGMWSCNKEDVDDEDPFVTIEPAALTFEATGGTQKVTIKSNRDWSIPPSADWISCTPTQGNGDTEIEVTVLANGDAQRVGKLSITASTASGTISITQKGAETEVVGDALYYEKFGTSVEQAGGKWPFIDQFTGWIKGGSLDQSGVTYSGSGASVCAMEASYDPAEGQGFSGSPVLYMGSTTATFTINKINVTGKTNLTFVCGALYQSAYEAGKPVFEALTSTFMKLQASVNGTNWSDLTYTVDGIVGWNKVISEFKVPDGTTTLYIKVSDLTNADNNHQYRLDDFTVLEGGNGKLIGEGGGEPDVDYPKIAMTSFDESFDDIVDYKTFTSEQWAIYSSDPKWTSDPTLGWHGRAVNNGMEKYLACAPDKTTLSGVVAYAVMAPFNVSGATTKSLSFDVAWYYQTADDTKLELVASRNFAGDVNTATWTVVKDLTFAAGTPMNDWVTQSVDLSATYGSDSKVYFAFRYTGKSNIYRIDNIAFGKEVEVMFGLPQFTATTLVAGSAIVDGKISIPYTNAKGTESYNVTVAVSNGDGIVPINPAVTTNLTAGSGSIELVITGTPVAAGTVTFTIGGIAGIATTTVTATIAKQEAAPFAAEWNMYGCPTWGDSPMAMTSAAIDGVTVGDLTKFGFTTNGTPGSNNWGGVDFSGNTEEVALSAPVKYVTFTVSSAAKAVSLTSVAAIIRITKYGPTKTSVQYSLDGTTFKQAGTFEFSRPSGTTTFEPDPVDLSGIADLQNVAANKTITIRLVPVATPGTTTGNWFLTSTKADISAFVVNGMVQ